MLCLITTGLIGQHGEIGNSPDDFDPDITSPRDNNPQDATHLGAISTTREFTPQERERGWSAILDPNLPYVDWVTYTRRNPRRGSHNNNEFELDNDVE